MVYLLHFSLPYWHAQHYVGYTTNLKGRMFYHRRGEGSKLIKAVLASGRRVVISRRWLDGDRGKERRIKNTHGGVVKLCPICSGRKAYTKGRGSKKVLPPDTGKVYTGFQVHRSGSCAPSQSK